MIPPIPITKPQTPRRARPGGEYVDAFRAEGLRVGLYYSLVDWHHPDYPAYNDPFHPMRGTDVRREERCDFSRYLDYMHAQVRELCTNYGKLDLLWFDFFLRRTLWRGLACRRTCRDGAHAAARHPAQQPAGGERRLAGKPALRRAHALGRLRHPRADLPPAPLCRPDGTPVCWEACQTMNNSFVHGRGPVLQNGAHLHPPAGGMRLKGGNYLLNVGPDARGNIPPQSRRILCEIGEWMRLNADSIYGCGASAISRRRVRLPRHRPRQNLYLHVMEQPVGPLALTGLSPRRHPIRTCARNRRRGGHPDKRLGRAELSPNCVSQPGSAGQRNAPPAG